jgi:thymidylate synthase (FAD)
MKIIKPYAKMLPPANDMDSLITDQFEYRHGLHLLKHIEWCARISHRSEDAVTQDSWKKIIQHVVLEHGDWSVVEHATVSVDAYVDRGITHEIVRHRLFSYTQESTRFVNYEKKIPPSFIYPVVGVECEFCLAGDEAKRAAVHDTFWSHQHGGPCLYDETWLGAIQHAENVYKGLLAKKWAPQLARSVFPNALASRIIITGNLRNWRHFLVMRTSKETHPQMKQVTIPLLKEFQEKVPMIFDDIIPDQKQSEAGKRMR